MTPKTKDKGIDKTKKANNGKKTVARQYNLDPEIVHLLDQIHIATGMRYPHIIEDSVRVYARVYIVSDVPSIVDLAMLDDPDKIRRALSEVASRECTVEAETGPSETCDTSEVQSPSKGPETASNEVDG